MHDSFTSKTEAEADGLPIGHRYWYGFPVASDLPFDRGGLGAGGLSSSAADMTHYLSAYLQRRPIRGLSPGLPGGCRRTATSRRPDRAGRRWVRDGLGDETKARPHGRLPRRQWVRLTTPTSYSSPRGSGVWW